MISPESTFQILKDNDIQFFTGVPDSLLKDFCAYITDHTLAHQHIIAANEGNAIALASGYYLGTGKIASVYMQNSGFGNALNPILSLADREVYSIPMLLWIGWRGEPTEKDEPQHKKQGRVMKTLLESVEIPYVVLDSTSDLNKVLVSSIEMAKIKKMPIAILVRKGTFSAYKLKSELSTSFSLNRESAIHEVIKSLTGDEMIVSTTGMASRELFEYRVSQKNGHGKDFLTVGAMGHTGSIAMGLALSTSKKVICLDGDGSLLMHMGSMGVIGQSNLKNLVHIVINNGAHDSVGGQPTVGFDIDLISIAKSCKYTSAYLTENVKDLKTHLSEILKKQGTHFLEIRVNKGSRENLGRPTSTPIQNKIHFMKEMGLEETD